MSTNIPAILVNGLYKNYQIYERPIDRLKEALHPLKKSYHKKFSALKGLGFSINKGESVAIIGKNGSGKSTLLKIITGVVSPSAGNIQVNGKVAAILELGSGFNPELTGLENIYLNTALNGISRSQAEQQLKSIVEFAELGDFIHQPVKNYSSGMRARLAFAVSIHVEPDILIVDEALSVGDAAFARKCFARMEEIRASGATILFVSHSLSSVITLCNRAIWISQGEQVLDGPPKAVTDLYMKHINKTQIDKGLIATEFQALIEKQEQTDEAEPIKEQSSSAQITHKTASDTGLQDMYNPLLVSKTLLAYDPQGAMIQQPQITTLDGKQANVLVQGRHYIYSYRVSLDEYHAALRCGFAFKTLKGLTACGGGLKVELTPGTHAFTVKFEFICLLHEGSYFLNAGVKNADGEFIHRIVDALMIQVRAEPSDINHADMICNLIVGSKIEPLT